MSTTIEEALKELRELFPDEQFFSVEITAREDHGFGLRIARVQIGGMCYKGCSLDEAMSRLRAAGKGMFYELDVKFKQYAEPLARILREKFGHTPDVRDAGNVIEFHFPTVVRSERYQSIRHFVDSFVAAIKYNS